MDTFYNLFSESPPLSCGSPRSPQHPSDKPTRPALGSGAPGGRAALQPPCGANFGATFWGRPLGPSASLPASPQHTRCGSRPQGPPPARSPGHGSRRASGGLPACPPALPGRLTSLTSPCQSLSLRWALMAPAAGSSRPGPPPSSLRGEAGPGAGLLGPGRGRRGSAGLRGRLPAAVVLLQGTAGPPGSCHSQLVAPRRFFSHPYTPLRVTSSALSTASS